MKKALLSLLLAALLLLTACGADHSTPAKLVADYLQQVHAQNYEAIWAMIPEPLQDYAVWEGILRNRSDGPAFVAYAVQDYHWLRELDLPSCRSYTFEILDEGEDDCDALTKYLRNHGVTMQVDGAYGVRVRIETDTGRSVEAGFYLIHTGGRWALTSVVGDDELVEY